MKIFTFYLLDGFVPLGKDDFDKAHEANVDVLNKAIDEVVAKQLDLGVDIVNDGEKIVFNIFANHHKQQRSRNDKMIFNQSLAHAEKEILSKTPFIAFSKGQSKEFVVFDL